MDIFLSHSSPAVLLEVIAFGVKQIQDGLKIRFSFVLKSLTYVIKLENVLKFKFAYC